jgi:hypothetical protein
MKYLDFIPPLVAFIAVTIGVYPVTKWDATQEGFRQLTTWGWVTVGLGAAALVASILTTFKRHNELHVKKGQLEEIKKIAHSEIRLGLRQITWVFFTLFGSENEDSWLELVPPNVDDPETLNSVLKVDLRSNERVHYGTFNEPWFEILKLNSDKGALKIDRALQIYASYLEPEVLYELSEVRTCEFLVLRLQRLDQHVSDNKQVQFLTFPFPGNRDGDYGYEKFWQHIRRLDELLEKEPARLKRRL